MNCWESSRESSGFTGICKELSWESSGIVRNPVGIHREL